ncbi:MAG: hypothetical protein QOD99_55 [Chthoniobacter sp.]|nr:hypothetical protein [Chthoniobacter sp.]
MNATPDNLRVRSVHFAARETARCRHRAARALEHNELMCGLGIGPGVELARAHVREAIGHYRGALSKFARELTAPL